MPRFERRLRVPVSQAVLCSWHLRNGAFERLCPPWQRIRTLFADPVEEGGLRVFQLKRAGLWLRWEAEHRDVLPPQGFTDIQRAGPFRRWKHVHRFEQVDQATSELVDHIEYELPFGALGRALGGPRARHDLERVFGYRHRTTAADLLQHAHAGQARWRVAVSGASGLIGGQLVAFLRGGGHQVLRLVRDRDQPAEDEIRWSVGQGVRDLDRLEGLDAIVHLAGVSVGQRWNETTRHEIRDSRVLGTRAIVEAIAATRDKPKALLTASAIGYYGDTGADIVDEDASLGQGFLADVCDEWETEAQRAEEHCRTARLRIGVVMDPRGGALAKLLPLFKAGLGGRIGRGNQLVSWVGLDDVLGAFHAALQHEALAGAINVTSPHPVTQAELAKTLGHVLSRPTVATTPDSAVALMFGDMGRETVLGSVGARPARLLAQGYDFRAPTLEQALRHCLGRPGR